jgi:hypothetical protein
VGELGIAPPGFSGLCVFPSSVFASDLIIDFSSPVIELSVLYSTQELGCDSSARMRVTAFMDGVDVGTNTTTAPIPGTWPSGTLSIDLPGGFNRALVHYDARPPTCQDYGVIFLADNVTVTMLCQAPVISAQPAPVAVCPAGSATFSVSAGSTAGLSYQWRKNASPIDVGVNASAVTDVLVVSASGATDGGGPGSYDCVITSACGSSTTDSAMLTICPADFNCDGFVDFFDFDEFVLAFESGTPAADFNSDGFVDFFDFDDFVLAFETGC